jgi:hypothetical protein
MRFIRRSGGSKQKAQKARSQKSGSLSHEFIDSVSATLRFYNGNPFSQYNP